MKQYISIDAGEPIKTAIDLLLDSRLLITQNNEPVGTLNRDQIIVVFQKRRKCCNSFCHEQKLNLSGRGNTFRKYLRIGLQNKTNLMLWKIMNCRDTRYWKSFKFLLIKGAKSKMRIPINNYFTLYDESKELTHSGTDYYRIEFKLKKNALSLGFCCKCWST
jgi:hypothetical protein